MENHLDICTGQLDAIQITDGFLDEYTEKLHAKLSSFTTEIVDLIRENFFICQLSGIDFPDHFSQLLGIMLISRDQ